jgi:hypothetical protein
MSRIDGIGPARAGLLARIAYWLARRRLGRVPGPLRVYAHSNAVLQAVGGFELALERARRVEPRLLALAQLRTGALVGCPF